MNEQSKDKLREYLLWSVALQRSMEVALRGEDPSNVWKHGGYKQFARKYNQILAEVAANVLPLVQPGNVAFAYNNLGTPMPIRAGEVPFIRW